MVQAPPLYIEEKVHPKALVDDLLRQTREARHKAGQDTRPTSSPTSTASPRAWTRPNCRSSLLVITADVDYRVGLRDGLPIVEFSWAGDDDGNPISGRGWARLDRRGLIGRLFIHGGDEAEFVARRSAAR